MRPEPIRTHLHKSSTWGNGRIWASRQPSIRSVKCGNNGSGQSVRLTLGINPRPARAPRQRAERDASLVARGTALPENALDGVSPFS